MSSVLLVFIVAFVLALAAWVIAREMKVTHWIALTAAGATFIAVGALGLAVLSFLSTSAL